MSWQFFLVVNLIFGSAREFLNKKIANKTDPFLGFFYIIFFSGLWLYLVHFALNRNWPRLDLGVAATGAFIVVGFVSYLAAVRISLSQSILFQSYSVLVTMALAAVFLGEFKYFDPTTTAGLKVISGTILAFLSLWFLLHTGKKNEEKVEGKWIVYIILTIVFMGLGSFASVSYLKTFTPLEVLLNQTNMIFLILLALLILQKKRMSVTKKQTVMMLSSSVVSTIAVIAFFEGLRLLPVAKFFPLQQLSLVISTMTIGVIFYKEAHFFTGRKIWGMVLGFAGMVLLITA